jgi:hypothetical protein
VDASGTSPAGAVHVHRFSLRAASRVVRLKAEPEGSFEMPVGIPAVVLGWSAVSGTAAAPATGYEPEYTLRLRPHAELRGRVVGPDGAPLAGARVTQVPAMRFADKFVFVTPPNDQGRVQKRGSNVFLVPCYCLSGVATSDAEGLFRLFGLPPCDGKVLLRVARKAASDSVWVEAAGFSEVVLAPAKGPLYRLPDGSAVDELPVAAPDPEVEDEPLPPSADPREPRRQRMRELLLKNSPANLDALIEALADEDEALRRDAVRGLEQLGRIPSCRIRVFRALRALVSEGDPSLNVALAAAAALAGLGERLDPAPFLEALRRNDADERLAAFALAQLLRRDAIELILARMERSEHAAELGIALETLTGARYGEQQERWRLWLEFNRVMLPPQAPVADQLPDAAAYLRRAEARFRRKDVQGARADLDATLRRDGPSAPALALRAWVRMKEGDLDGARSDADHSIRLNPGEPSLRALRAAVLDPSPGAPPELQTPNSE